MNSLRNVLTHFGFQVPSLAAIAFASACGTMLAFGGACGTTPVETEKPLETEKPVDPGKVCDTTADCQTRFGDGWICENRVCENVTDKAVDIAENEAVYIPGVAQEAQDIFREGVQAALSVPPEYDRAITAFEKSVEIDPGFLEGYFNIGTVYEKKGQADKALEAYQRAIKANPNSPDAKAFVGKIFLAKAKGLKASGKEADANQLLTKAKAAFDEVMAQDFENVPANNGLALYWLLKGDAGQAEEHVKQVLINEPDNVTALNSRGLVFLQAGQLNFAEWIFKQKVLTLDANSVEAHTNLGTVYVRNNLLPLAVQHFTTATKLDPSNVAAHLNLGKIYLEYLNYKDARDRFEAALKLEPENVEAVVGLGTCQLGLNQFDEAIATYDKAVKMDKRRASLFEEIAKLYQKKGSKPDMAKAIEYFKRYVTEAKLGPDSTAAKTAFTLQDAYDKGFFDTPTEPKTPEGEVPPDGEAPKAPETEAPKAPETEAPKAPETEAPKAPETEAPKAPEGETPLAPEPEKLPEPPPPTEPGKDGAPGNG